jgi:hypothetical protein
VDDTNSVALTHFPLEYWRKIRASLPVVGSMSLPNFQVIEIEKAPQIGLEPTTLRLTEGFHVFAGCCGLLLIHSLVCFYRFFGVADFNNVLL